MNPALLIRLAAYGIAAFGLGCFMAGQLAAQSNMQNKSVQHIHKRRKRNKRHKKRYYQSNNDTSQNKSFKNLKSDYNQQRNEYHTISDQKRPNQETDVPVQGRPGQKI